MRFGMGFGLMSEMIPLSPNPRSFFWGGWGGSMSVIDLDEAMTVTYVMNKMATDLIGDMRGIGIVFAAYEALGRLTHPARVGRPWWGRLRGCGASLASPGSGWPSMEGSRKSV